MTFHMSSEAGPAPRRANLLGSSPVSSFAAHVARTCSRCGVAVEDAWLCVDCYDGKRPVRPCGQCGRPTRRGVSHSKTCKRLGKNARQTRYRQRAKSERAALPPIGSPALSQPSKVTSPHPRRKGLPHLAEDWGVDGLKKVAKGGPS